VWQKNIHTQPDKRLFRPVKRPIDALFQKNKRIGFALAKPLPKEAIAFRDNDTVLLDMKKLAALKAEGKLTPPPAPPPTPTPTTPEQATPSPSPSPTPTTGAEPAVQPKTSVPRDGKLTPRRWPVDIRDLKGAKPLKAPPDRKL
jgi:hypothetical protein